MLSTLRYVVHNPTFLIAVLSAVLFVQPAAGQDSRDLEKQLTLPRDAEKPDPPVSDKACFARLSGGALLEVVLYKDGSLLGFEKRTLQDVMDGTSHAVRLRGEENIRRLLRYAATVGGKKKVGVGENSAELADVDLVVHAAPDVPYEKFFKLMIVACEEGIRIYRFYFVVKDKETGKKGVLCYYLPCCAVGFKNPEDLERLAGSHRVCFMPTPQAILYSLQEREGGEEGKTLQSLAELEKEIKALQQADPKVSIVLEIYYPAEALEPEMPATMKDLIDLLTLLASRGADLQNIMTEVVPIEEVEDSDG